MVNKGNAQGIYQSASGRVGCAILPYPFRFFSWKVGHTLLCGQLGALVVMQSSSLCMHCNTHIALQAAVYAKYTIGGAHDTNIYIYRSRGRRLTSVGLAQARPKYSIPIDPRRFKPSFFSQWLLQLDRLHSVQKTHTLNRVVYRYYTKTATSCSIHKRLWMHTMSWQRTHVG